MDLFIETTRLRPVTIKLYANNILSPNEERTRLFYDDARNIGSVEISEYREAGGGMGTRVIGFQVAGTF